MAFVYILKLTSQTLILSSLSLRITLSLLNKKAIYHSMSLPECKGCMLTTVRFVLPKRKEGFFVYNVVSWSESFNKRVCLNGQIWLIKVKTSMFRQWLVQTNALLKNCSSCKIALSIKPPEWLFICIGI